MTALAETWDRLHAEPRYRPRYPSECAVRFVAGLPPSSRVLDVGCGCGRHLKLLAEQGHQAFGVDVSHEGLKDASEWLLACGECEITLALAAADCLPYQDEYFDGVIAYGSLYYGTKEDMERGVAEIHRVLCPGGRALVVLRRTEDSRYGMGRQVWSGTFELAGTGTGEDGMVVTFLGHQELRAMFAEFGRVEIEATTTTRRHGSWRDADWIIIVEKT